MANYFLLIFLNFHFKLPSFFFIFFILFPSFFVQGFREKTDVLDELPRMGRMVAEISDENVKELSLYSYRIIYEIRSEKVLVLAVVHKRRDLSAEDIGNSITMPKGHGIAITP